MAGGSGFAGFATNTALGEAAGAIVPAPFEFDGDGSARPKAMLLLMGWGCWGGLRGSQRASDTRCSPVGSMRLGGVPLLPPAAAPHRAAAP